MTSEGKKREYNYRSRDRLLESNAAINTVRWGGRTGEGTSASCDGRLFFHTMSFGDETDVGASAL